MPIEESEWKTRKTRIDARLRAGGWEIVPFDPSVRLSAYHAAHYHKNLVDIISMVKHAAKDEEPQRRR